MRAKATNTLRPLTVALTTLTALFPAVGVAQSQTAVPQAAKDSGAELGVRVGYGLPFGETTNGSDLDSGISGQIPVILDAGYRFNPNVYAGIGVGYGFAQIKDSNNNCDGPNVSCSASVIRLGLNVLYRFVPEQRFAPFVGLGVGYEWFNLQGGGSVGPLNGNVSTTVSGFEFLNLQGGADYRLSGSSVIGPFASFSMGRFDNVSTKLTSGSTTSTTDGDINDTATHMWLLLGIRGAFSL